jgi:ribosomal-protein-alanine N-acetyltransferase
MAGVTVRRGGARDLEAVARIQQASPEAARWNPADYTAYDFLVALSDDRVRGFVVTRRVAEGESEILNLAVDPAWRRHGVARRLIDEIRLRHPGVQFLEVRESNASAREFYKSMGFQEVAERQGYYDDPLESAIVMKFHSC